MGEQVVLWMKCEICQELRQILLDYCAVFRYDIDTIMDHPFTVVVPDTKNPYQQMYVAN